MGTSVPGRRKGRTGCGGGCLGRDRQKLQGAHQCRGGGGDTVPPQPPPPPPSTRQAHTVKGRSPPSRYCGSGPSRLRGLRRVSALSRVVSTLCPAPGPPPAQPGTFQAGLLPRPLPCSGLHCARGHLPCGDCLPLSWPLLARLSKTDRVLLPQESPVPDEGELVSRQEPKSTRPVSVSSGVTGTNKKSCPGI